MNKVILTGNLTKAPDLRYTQTGTAYAKMSIAVPRPFTKGKLETDFLDLTVWNKQAEFCGRYFSKGSRILVEGRIENNNYTDKNGVKHYGYNITVENVEFAGGKPSKGKSEDYQEEYPPDVPPPEDEDNVGLPF